MNKCLKLIFVIDSMPIYQIKIVKFVVSLNNKVLGKVSRIMKFVKIMIKKKKNS